MRRARRALEMSFPGRAAVLVIAGAALALACERVESPRFPTEPANGSARSDRSNDGTVARMPITHIARGTPAARLTRGPGVTSSPTVTLTSGPSASPSIPLPTITATRTPSSTPTATPPAAAPLLIQLRGIAWQWDFYAPGVAGGSSVSLRVGQAYELHIFNDAPAESPSHTFSGIPALGLPGGIIEPGGSQLIQTFTPVATGSFPFLCTDSSCGVGHADMTGSIQIVR